MDYLNTDKSIMISSPAGSGKTEKLARRYIALLQGGVDVERILAITFTEKASAEMKQRILKILKKEDEKLFHHLLDRIPLIRVCTIHSFCGTLLRRFAFEAGIDPGYNVEDAIDAAMEWDEILYKVLMENQGARDKGQGTREDNFILQTLGEKGFRGLDYLKTTVDYLFHKRPFSLEAEASIHKASVKDELLEELRTWPGARDVIEHYERFFEKDLSEEIGLLIENCFLTDKKEPRKRALSSMKHIADYPVWAFKMYEYWKGRKIAEYAQRAGRVRQIFIKCLDKYTGRKMTKRALDFSDLEYIAYKMLTENPEWANILYAFDEKTDHLLVDEFQDTNNFQWAIISKLTEEWRSGLGAKREEGIRPTVFLVGDEKQSIYFFRGANVEIFRKAQEQMQEWLADEFSYEEAKENFRSLPVIIEFTNHVFAKIMQAGPNDYPWRTRYSAFSAHRSAIPDAGRVELILLNDEEVENIEEAKQKEADVLALRIQGLVGNFQVTDKNTQQQRFCKYSDLAILLRKRTHLKKYEDALRKYDIPFVAVKGIGFYQEPEVAMLRALVFFLSNPHDDYSLYMLLKSPLFNITESNILQLTNIEGVSLFGKIKDSSNGLNGLNSSLQNWLALAAHTPLAELIEHALVSTKAWRYFYEEQKRANIKKFIRIVEGLQADGKSIIMIRDFLERTLNKDEEPKANVNTEGMDAVRIMTIHAAKGLEFPIVLVPGIEEPFTPKTNDSLVYERDGTYFYKSVSESSIQKQDDDFLIHHAREEEELKRLFYVAVTRAEESLILTGNWNNRDRSFLSYLRQGLGLQKEKATFSMETNIDGVTLLTEEDVTMLYEHAHKHKMVKPIPHRAEVFPLTIPKQAEWKAVTETTDIRRRNGKDWLILGDIMHRIFEETSKGILQEQDLRKRAIRLLESKGISREQTGELTTVIEKNIATLKTNGLWQDLIMPRKNSFAELPFILEAGDTVYTGRIDRIIKEGNVYKIYDYKTSPVTEKELGHLLKEYSFQMNMYKNAARELFNTKDVRSFIVFTHTGEIKEV